MDRFIESYKNKEFDLLVIGGGITGAAVAYEAASRGISVALVEKADFGGATSAATSKMIHGGFRYLTKFEIGLVRESLRERRILMNIAPNFVHPLPFVFTHYKGDKYPKWMIKAGMIFYDLLSFDKNKLWDKSKKMPCHRSISFKKLINKEPEVISKNLTGGNLYFDGLNFYPERLTLAFIKSAVKNSAEVSNYSEVQDFIFEDTDGIKKLKGAFVKDLINNKNVIINSKLIINCAGPWADVVLNKISDNPNNKILGRSEGIHIITKKKINDYVITATTKNGRHCFFVPWRNHTLIGTTDKEFIGDPDEYRVTKNAVAELLEEVNPVFGNSEKITFDDVLFAYGGLRPLVENDTKESYKSSRKYEISLHEKDGISGLITVEGGKYTTSRNLAKKVIDKSFDLLNKNKVPSETHKKYLTVSEINNLRTYISEKLKQFPFLKEKQLNFLIRIYGTEVDDLMELVASRMEFSKQLNDDGEIVAQIIFAIRNEMAKTLADILFRRTGLGTLGHPGKEKLKLIAEIAANEAVWDDKRLKNEIEAVEKIFSIND
ncbi:MAG: glycerol-3-phosphate dehydrogenase/oxidase [Prolixibacteraceae bacterium]|nr:glycerol-3-phosphate dehydrogenase/oxidase [Prolixibacteraceae bacterium]MBN2774525.1 glycerol-3-phosphate dehydrogenase/oxidase [Prolixibacteraceae bacterium]